MPKENSKKPHIIPFKRPTVLPGERQAMFSKMSMNLATSLLGESLITAKDYLNVSELFQQSSFSTPEQQIILYIINHESRCESCMGVHSDAEMQDYSEIETLIPALQNGSLLTQAPWQNLQVFVRKLIKNNGNIATLAITDFLEAGFTQKNVMELVTLYAMKTISNYTHHIGS